MPTARKALVAASWCAGALVLAGFLWVWLGARNFAQMQLVASAQVSLEALARLDEAYRRGRGTYAADIDALLKAAGSEGGMRAALAKTVDLSTLKLRGDRVSYGIEAVALDEHRTRVTLRGPAR